MKKTVFEGIAIALITPMEDKNREILYSEMRKNGIKI